MRTTFFVLFIACRLIAAQAPHQDFFAVVAQRELPKRAQMSQKLPPILENRQLESTQSNPVVSIPPYKVMRSREEFRSALAALRRHYAPFLEKRTPALPTRARIELATFDFRMEESADRRDFSRVWRGEGTWTSLRLPDYRGPIGWWSGYYRKVLAIPSEMWTQQAIFLRFGAVDYRCQVYLNGRMVKTHEGLFGPFEVDVTSYLRRNAENILVIRIENESTMLGLESWNGPVADGDKLFAAVGPGWDEPGMGWHGCPPGAGIWQTVYLEGRPNLSITGIFVRPNAREGWIEARVEVNQREFIDRTVDLTVSLYPENFEGTPRENIHLDVMPAGPGMTEYRARIRMEGFRVWDPERPYLYTLRATIRPKNGETSDTQDSVFGMRDFRMDERSEIKGAFTLNGEPVILRGANTMGNFELDVMRGDREQLVEDLLIAKLANLNFLRLTQSPEQPDVYDLCDHLGMMVQTDLPLFAFLRRPQVEEAIRQSGEMERLVRGHASNILVSFINEPFPTEQQRKEHRHLTRGELNQFFEAASAVVKLLNPDRVIKAVEGDYDPPAPGLPDNHIYAGWYGSRSMPIGKVMRGYWIANKDGWKYGSGEYGAEGLEDAETMFRHYPKEWLPASVDQRWNPGVIPFAQTAAMYGNWFDHQETMREWIAAGQAHQAWVIGTMTRAFRRQTDRIISTAVHLLIDAWPACWMKALVDVDRHPKPAYFELREALTPLLVDIRTDRTRYFAGERTALEFWICNDRRAPAWKGALSWEVWQGERRLFAQSTEARIPSFGAIFQGYFRFLSPPVRQRERLTIRLGLQDGEKRLVHATEQEIEVFPARPLTLATTVAVVGEENGRAWKLAQQLGLTPLALHRAGADVRMILVDRPAAWDMVRGTLLPRVHAGITVLFLEQESGAVWRLGAENVTVQGMLGKEFVSRKTGHPLVQSFLPLDFSYWFDREKDYIGQVASTYLDGPRLRPVLTSVTSGPSVHRVPVVAEMPLGAGSLLFSQLTASDRVTYEPVAATFYDAIVERAYGKLRSQNAK